MACFVSNTNTTSPSSGALITASSGVTTAPSPIILPANPSSGAVERSAAFPVIGLDTITVFTTFFVSVSCLSSSDLSVSSDKFSLLSVYSISGAVSR